MDILPLHTTKRSNNFKIKHAEQIKQNILPLTVPTVNTKLDFNSEPELSYYFVTLATAVLVLPQTYLN